MGTSGGSSRGLPAFGSGTATERCACWRSEEFDRTSALLLERCLPGVSLWSVTGPEQDVVIAGLLRRLWLFRSLPSTADQQVLLCIDHDAGTVLAAEREPRSMIDPKPHVGDPVYDPPS